MTLKDHLGGLPLVHATLLLDHQVPDVLPVGPAQLGQRSLAATGRLGRLGDEGAEPGEKNIFRSIHRIYEMSSAVMSGYFINLETIGNMTN